jgi:hypothetical protein
MGQAFIEGQTFKGQLASKLPFFPSIPSRDDIFYNKAISPAVGWKGPLGDNKFVDVIRCPEDCVPSELRKSFTVLVEDPGYLYSGWAARNFHDVFKYYHRDLPVPCSITDTRIPSIAAKLWVEKQRENPRVDQNDLFINRVVGGEDAIATQLNELHRRLRVMVIGNSETTLPTGYASDWYKVDWNVPGLVLTAAKRLLKGQLDRGGVHGAGDPEEVLEVALGLLREPGCYPSNGHNLPKAIFGGLTELLIRCGGLFNGHRADLLTFLRERSRNQRTAHLNKLNKVCLEVAGGRRPNLDASQCCIGLAIMFDEALHDHPDAFIDAKGTIEAINLESLRGQDE